MALLVVLNTEGKPVLVHSSIYDRLVRVQPDPKPWAGVWQRFDALPQPKDQSHG